MFGWYDFFGQPAFERGQSAPLYQLGILIDLADQTFLRGGGKNLFFTDTQYGRCFLRLPRYAGGNRVRSAQLVPQRVDLVEDNYTSAFLIALGYANMVFPDCEIGPRYAGIGSQHKDNDVCIGKHAHSQLGFGAEGVKAGRIQNDETLFEQGVWIIYDRVPP